MMRAPGPWRSHRYATRNGLLLKTACCQGSLKNSNNWSSRRFCDSLITAVCSGLPWVVFYTSKMDSPPGAEMFQHRKQGEAVLGDGIGDAALPVVGARDDAVVGELFEVPDQHPFRDLRDALFQLDRAPGAFEQAPENRALPPSVDDGKSGVNRAWRDLFF